MAGILDKKSRVIDAIITQEGKRQIASGKLEAKWYSFSDANIDYNNQTNGGVFDNSSLPTFEATSLPQDTITLEADDSGRLVSFPANGKIIKAGKIYSINTTKTEYTFGSDTLLRTFTVTSPTANTTFLSPNPEVWTEDPAGITTQQHVSITNSGTASNVTFKFYVRRVSDNALLWKGSVTYPGPTGNYTAFFNGTPYPNITIDSTDSLYVLCEIPKNTTNWTLINFTLYYRDITGSQQVVGGGFVNELTLLDGDDFISQADDVMASSFDNFEKLMVLKTPDSIFDDDTFTLSSAETKLAIKPMQTININEHDALFSDEKLSHIKNFMYLPPINKQNQFGVKTSLGRYDCLTYDPLSVDELFSGLSQIERMKNDSVAQISFESTSRDNLIGIQLYELSDDTLLKLDAIDFGRRIHENIEKRIIFYGKVIDDSNDTHHFIHMFTMVLE